MRSPYTHCHFWWWLRLKSGAFWLSSLFWAGDPLLWRASGRRPAPSWSSSRQQAAGFLRPSAWPDWADASCIIDSLSGHLREGERRQAHVAAKGDNMTSCLWLWRKRHKHNQTRWGWHWNRRLFRAGDRTCFLTSVPVRSRAARSTPPFTLRPWELQYLRQLVSRTSRDGRPPPLLWLYIDFSFGSRCLCAALLLPWSPNEPHILIRAVKSPPFV